MEPVASTIYQDHPLDPAKRDIRTLQLLPGNGAENISVNIRVQDLDDPSTSYICLSYVWGTEVASEFIQADTTMIEVTANLLDCLRHLRSTESIIVLWVDAVCINQGDLQEKSAQVAMMGDIYSRCSTVCCWLGVPLDATLAHRNPFEFIYHFAENKHYHDLPGFSIDDSANVRFEENAEFRTLWERFLSVANSTWWNRAWTVQEVVVPKDAVIRLGTWTANFDTFAAAKELRNIHLFETGPHSCDASLQAFPAPMRKAFDEFLSRIDWIERYREADPLENSLLTPTGAPKTFPEFRCRPFYEVVLTLSNRACKDPLDKVFSLLALAKSSALQVHKPDYSRSTNDAYTKAFQLMLEETDNDLRCLVGPAFGPENPNCPSWVPDFSQTVLLRRVEFTLRRIMLSSLFRASNGKVGKLKQLQGSSLSLSGLYADTVTTVCPAFEPDVGPDHLRKILMDWSALCRDTLHTSDEESVRLKLSHIMCAGIVFDGGPLHAFNGGWKRLRAGESLSVAGWQQFMEGNMWALPERYRGTMETLSSGRCLFATQGGRMGLCYNSVHPGDEVWVVKGSNLPFILRDVCKGDEIPYEYHFVGDCTLDGIMDGEIPQSKGQWSSLILV
ncbi:heterokaryon incompatibility protein-domain-containing protein [Xylaria sp. FL0043]|nr:heterokaryon incompatibility protein-domain-containing protein [Xylaria sp. FL0043]